MPLPPNNGDATANSLLTPAIGTAMAQPVPTSPTGPPPPFPPSSSSSAATTPTPIAIRPSHNDLNDAQNISKILHSIHNGSNSTINSNHNNHSNDKRLFADDQLSITKANHKEDGMKANDEKQHHRSRRKPKATIVTSSTSPASAAKQNQHKHTNGINNSNSDIILSNCIRLLNGDEDYDDEQIEKWKHENLETRSMAFKEIRKFGRNYNGLYKELEKIKGTFDMRLGFIQMCIEEALRFRRKHMATCIQEWWDAKCDEKNIDSMGKIKT